MAEKEARLQGNEDVESGGFSTEEDESVTSIYLFEGKAFSISMESQEVIDVLTNQLKEALSDTGQRATNMEMIVDRVQTLMAKNFRDIKGTKKLKDKVKGLRTNLRKRITALNTRILPMLEVRNLASHLVAAMITTLKESTMELQRLMTDEAALTLILRKDMNEDDRSIDAALRKDRIDISNDLIRQARLWVEDYGPGEGSPGGRLNVLGSAGVSEVDTAYDTAVA